MRFTDLLALILENLGRRKTRAALTAVGVVIGTAAVVVLVSLAAGLQQTVTLMMTAGSDLTQITVAAVKHNATPLAEALPTPTGTSGGKLVRPQPEKLLTDEALAVLRRLPHVEAIILQDQLGYYNQVNLDALQWSGAPTGISDLSQLPVRVQTGTLALQAGQVVVGALVKDQFHLPDQHKGQPTPASPQLYGRQLRLKLSKYTANQSYNKTLLLSVVGVLAPTNGDPDNTIYMQLAQERTLNRWLSDPKTYHSDYDWVTVKADDISQVGTLAQRIRALGYTVTAQQDTVNRMNTLFAALQVVFGAVGAVSLVVAAIGIANTMTMAVLERTHEIGLMKALGATEGDVLGVFLGEAAAIGLLGGLGGLALGWGVDQAINFFAQRALTGMVSQFVGGGTIAITFAYMQPWLPPFAVVFAGAVGLLSGLLPARRAARLVPVVALKQE